mmetsp:Transcript_29153/g.70987  ORF Transcript_29153/g.70987 Transcript_29153/m.70987 type:complete len:293 (-) Transcript_29153:64-942(-)
MLVATVATIAMAAAAAAAANADLGDQLHRTYTRYEELPTTVAGAAGAGWKNTTQCVAGVGWRYAYDSTTGGDEDHPLELYFTRGGQVSGMAINVWGEVPKALVDAGFWRADARDGAAALPHYYMRVGFREPSTVCTTTSASPHALGDRVVVNADTQRTFSVPLALADAVEQHYVKGACFSTMGTHYFYDLANSPNGVAKMSWKASTLMPLVPMYHNGTLNAVFFASSAVQQDLFDAHWWEPTALINYLMCKNWCDDDCTFEGTSAWSTMHVYFRDYNKVTCPGGCSIACCES